MADDAVGAAELINDSVGNAALAAEALKFAKFTYDFSSDGGAVSSITLGTLPDKAIVVRGHAEVETAVTSAGSATVALGIVANTDAFVGATAKGSLTLNAVLATSNDLPLKMSGDTPVLKHDCDGGLSPQAKSTPLSNTTRCLKWMSGRTRTVTFTPRFPTPTLRRMNSLEG